MFQKDFYEERQLHRTAELPIALHQLKYPEGTEILFYLHWHKEFEFFVVTQGFIELTIEDRTYLLKPGDCAFINSNLYHSGKSVNGDGCTFFALDFFYGFLDEDLHTNFGRRYISPVLEGKLVYSEVIHATCHEEDSWQAEVVRLLHEINSCGEKELALYELMIKSHILNIWHLYYKHAEVTQADDEKDMAHKNLLKPVISYMKLNYTDEITLSVLSNIIPMSEGHFCRVFKEVMMITPFQYLMNYRIMQSCRLLIETDKKIGEVANLSGFSTISYYNKVFLKIIGCTPKQYKESYFNKSSIIECIRKVENH